MADHPEGPIRVALIGYGLAGAVFHGPLISSTPGMSLATIVTRDPERRARASSDHPEAQLLDGVDALWRRAADHDLVVVATPNRSHVPLGLAALEAGLPVVMDKPVAPTAEEGRRLVAEATERDLLLAVFQNRRWDGDFLTVRRLLSEDALGPVVRFESRFERWRPRVRPEAWRERGDPEEAGGLLFDLGSHLIDQAVVLFGPPRTVYAEVDRRRPSAEVDDDVFVALEHGAGVRSHLWMSVLAAIPGPRMRVLGMGAAYEKFGLDGQERALSEGARPDDPDWGREPPDRWGRLSTGDGARAVETEPGAYPEFYPGIAASLRDGTPPPVDPNDSVMGLEIIEAALESARTDGVVEVG
ncbi:MAG TPA: Gfo/Idh/MocA family oxidoreductase [Actinomycetota bacterium]|nr:Gfo/Idh/MocA family oxidoreductase [Actinomycetota bacterium]